ncbi:MAG: GHKL domain-containing protein [Chitinispirillaceae bacterium]|nr:GHKL domain-containing protein [Chitinispirillaceae bacterium]
MCCVFWNQVAAEMTGMDAQSVISQPIGTLFPGCIDKNLENLFLTILENGGVTQCRVQWGLRGIPRNLELTLFSDTTEIFVLVKDELINSNAEMRNKVSEEQTIQYAQSQELRLLGQLTSGVAHEVRNPLNAISVVLEALFQDIGEHQEYRLYKEHLFTHVERLKRLMQDLLELGRPIERSKITNFDIEDLVRETVDMWGTSTLCSKFTIDLQADSTADLRVKGNSLKMQQVFMNLLDNAAQHSKLEKKISIVISCESGCCCVRIVDYGTGIKPEHLEKIFDPFFTTRKRGTGLGLSIVKHVVEVHGGRVTIENNKVPPGCMVTVMLPQVQQVKKCAQMDTSEIQRGCISSFVL